MELLKGHALRAGDLIGLVSPASPIADVSRIDQAVRYLEGLGYRVRIGEHVTDSYGYLAGSDRDRVADLHAMFADPAVRAVFCIRGGYGTPRLLSHINYRLIRNNPKIFAGYSDITALELAFWRKTGLITFHGPMAGVDLAGPPDPFTEEMFWSMLSAKKKRGRITLPDPLPRTLQGGRATGRLLGGNLALVVSTLGTPYQPDLRDALLFLEDISEEPYRIDRMLTQLRNAGILQRSAAVLTGQFTDCVPQDATKPTLTLAQILEETAALTGRPFLAGLPFGHESPKMTLPVGLRARLDASSGTLELLEAAVR
jgi:muramoyltetrapeptide carboxypeptidase